MLWYVHLWVLFPFNLFKDFDGNIIAKKEMLVKTFLKFARFPKAFKQQVLFLQKFKIFTKGI